MVESMYISRDEKFKIEIDIIEFRSDFMQNKLIRLDELLEEKLASEYRGKEVVKKLKEEELRKLLVIEEEQQINFRHSLGLNVGQKLRQLNDMLARKDNLGMFVCGGIDGFPMDIDYTF